MKSLFALITFLLTMLIVSAQIDEQYIVIVPTLNLREGPGTNYNVISNLSKGEIVIPVEKSTNDWWLVNYNGFEGYLFSKYLRKDSIEEWEQLSLESGDTPPCDNITPDYDSKIDNYLRINVGQNTDVVIKLMRMIDNSNKCIRIVYVRRNDSFDIKNIPQGKCFLKIAYGSDFRYKVIDNKCVVKFRKNAIYEIGMEILDFTIQTQPDQIIGDQVRKSWIIPTYELSLDVIGTDSQNSFDSKIISEDEFNK